MFTICSLALIHFSMLTSLCPLFISKTGRIRARPCIPDVLIGISTWKVHPITAIQYKYYIWFIVYSSLAAFPSGSSRAGPLPHQKSVWGGREVQCQPAEIYLLLPFSDWGTVQTELDQVHSKAIHCSTCSLVGAFSSNSTPLLKQFYSTRVSASFLLFLFCLPIALIQCLCTFSSVWLKIHYL